MIDPDAREQQALQTAMKFMGELMAEIGWATHFSELSAEQARALAEAAIDGFQEAMAVSGPKTDLEVPF